LLGGGLLALAGLSRGPLGGRGLAALGGSLINRGATGHCNLYQALGVNTAEPNRRGGVDGSNAVTVEHSVIIGRPREELYRFWRDFSNLARFMPHLESVQPTGGNRSHWVARGPLGHRAEWDAEVTEERPNERIAWRSLPGSEIATEGSVEFRTLPAGRGTLVKTVTRYSPPGGKVGAALAWFFDQSPGIQIREDLRRFKRLMETGEIPTTRGQPSGRGRDEFEQTGMMVVQERFAAGIGWFSIGLGMTQLLAPEAVANFCGVSDHTALMRMLGAREVATGVGILMQQRPAGWLWGRVVGDVMDLSLLGSALLSPTAKKERTALATAMVLGVTAADLICSLQHSSNSE